MTVSNERRNELAIEACRKQWNYGLPSLEFFAGAIQDVIEWESWREIPIGIRVWKHETFTAWVEAYHNKGGLNATMSEVGRAVHASLNKKAIHLFDTIQADENKLASPGAPVGNTNNPQGLGGRSGKMADIDKGSNSTINNPKQDRSSTYLLRRIARDNPDVYEAFKRGDFPNVRQAAIAAGVVTVPTPYEQVLKLLPKLSTGEREQLKSEL